MNGCTNNEDPDHLGKPFGALWLLVPAGLLAVLLIVIIRGEWFAPFTSDAAHFFNLAQRMATGRGYTLDAKHSFWPDTPSLQRMPLWPILQVPLHVLFPERLVPGTVRFLNACLHGLSALLIASATWRLFRNRRAAMIAGWATVLHPYLIDLAAGGLAEPLFVLLAASGAGLAINRRYGAAAWPLGLACLVRPNMILFPVFFAGLFMVRHWRSKRHVPLPAGTLLLAALIFYLPITAWVARNVLVSGAFPVISTLRGQTFYGGNNPVVAQNLQVWGYWIFPNAIPGEEPLVRLARNMSEVEVDRYYMRQGLAYVHAHASDMPRLLLGKCIRAYVPIPWVPGITVYVAALYRAVFNLFGLAGLLVCWRKRTDWLPVAGALYLTNLVTVLLFWGCGRFAMEAEPLVLLPYAGVALASMRVARS